jgi:large subunit ribosomal protein L20
MPRVKRGFKARRRRKKVLHQVRGYVGAKSKVWKTAIDALHRSWKYMYRHRKERKRNFRRLWSIRIGAAARMFDLNYSRFIHGLKKAGVNLNRKMLAAIAVSDLEGFKVLVDISRSGPSRREGLPAAQQPIVGVPAAQQPIVGVPAAQQPVVGVPAAQQQRGGVPTDAKIDRDEIASVESKRRVRAAQRPGKGGPSATAAGKGAPGRGSGSKAGSPHMPKSTKKK